MPKPAPKNISIKVTNGSAGEYVKVTNITAGGSVTGQLASNGELILSPAKSDLTWSEDDIIHASISGRINQVKSATIKRGGAQVTLDNAATTSMANVSL